nr:hypothetical protein [Sphingopyxis sp. BSNA05]
MIGKHPGRRLAAGHLQLLPCRPQAFVYDIGGYADLLGRGFRVMAEQKQVKNLLLFLVQIIATGYGHMSILCQGRSFGKKNGPLVC